MTNIIQRVRDHLHHLTSDVPPPMRPHQSLAVFPPPSPELIAATEAQLGFHLPPLLCALYTQVANGGFGPARIVGLDGGYRDTDNLVPHDGQGVSLVELYFGFRGRDHVAPELKHDFLQAESLMVDLEEWHGWFDKLLPICNWGCWQLSCIDCSKPSFPVIFVIGYGGEFQLESSSFDSWIEEWITNQTY